MKAWARQDRESELVQDALEYTGQLGDDATRNKIRENVRIFKPQWLEDLRKLSEAAPKKADLFFKNGYYESALAGFLKARGCTVADIQSGKVTAEVLDEGRSYAIQEAMKATFNDKNAFSDLISNARFRGDNVVGQIANAAMEGVLPFRRTPANIAVRIAEYSPAGLTKGVWDAAVNIRKGKVSAAAAVDQICAGLTGTGIMALGFFLAKGIDGVRLTGSGTDEDEKRQGHQDYALEFSIGGQEYSYKIDWAAPAVVPLFVGANIYAALQDKGEDPSISDFTAFVYGVANAFEPMLSLSMLSTLSEILESGKYSSGDAVFTFIASAMTGYFTQGIPAFVRQGFQAYQKNKQTTFITTDDPLLGKIQKKAAGAGLNIHQTDAVNAWGETESKGGLFRRVFDSFINPGTWKKIDNSGIEQEITRLSDAGYDVKPPAPARTVSYTGPDGTRHTNYRLTEEQYQTMAQTQGQTEAEILEDLTARKDYQSLTDDQKEMAYKYVYDYGAEKGRAAALDGYDGMAAWMREITEGQEAKAILQMVMGATLTDAFGALGTDTALGTQQLVEAWESISGWKGPDRINFANETGGRVKYFIDAKEAGVKTETFVELYQGFREIDADSGMTNTEKAGEWAYALEKARAAGRISQKQEDKLRESMKFFQMFPAGAEKFDAMTEAGISADDALDINTLLKGIVPADGASEAKAWQKAEAIAGAKLSEGDKVSAMKVYLSDAQDENLDLMIALGYGSEEYALAYKLYSGESGRGKKARTIRRIQDQFGVDYGTAKAIYEIYG